MSVNVLQHNRVAHNQAQAEEQTLHASGLLIETHGQVPLPRNHVNAIAWRGIGMRAQLTHWKPQYTMVKTVELGTDVYTAGCTVRLPNRFHRTALLSRLPPDQLLDHTIDIQRRLPFSLVS